ncbi:ATP-binding protein [Microtetraspora malaysiensis]|uniref:ATP-binding protein n=1 Tax=Microtetraspora malaysiensis TaxID=161358 RepID=UPI003D940DB2
MIPRQSSRESATRWHRTFSGHRNQVREARCFVRAHLPNHPDAELIVSELATNAVEHTRTGDAGGTFTATIKQQPDGTIYMEIEDQGGPTVFGEPTPNREGGRGLHLVSALTLAWGVKGDATGRTVWVELPRSDA